MKEVTKRLYAIAAKQGLVEGGEDAFHQIVYRITGKEHVSALTASEGKAVEAELLRMKRQSPPEPREEIPGMMTDGQQRYAWRLVYRLMEIEGQGAPAGERMAGAVRRVLGITAHPREPLKWVNRQDGSKLIEALKRYAASAEKKARDG